MLKQLSELHLLNLLSILLVGIVIGLPHSFLRIPLSLPFVLFSPGYALIAALYPRRDDLSGAERIALSLGASLAIVALIGLGLNILPWGVRLIPVLVSVAGVTTVCSILAAQARSRLAQTERFTIDIRRLLGQLRKVSWGQVAVAGIIIAAAVIAVWQLYSIESRTGETFTEFYVLNDSGKAEGYPDWVLAGTPTEVILGIINREMSRTTYTIAIRAHDRPEATLGPFSLEREEKLERKVQLNLSAGAHQEIQFLLFKDGSSIPYRRLHFWINVMPRKSSGASSYGLRRYKPTISTATEHCAVSHATPAPMRPTLGSKIKLSPRVTTRISPMHVST